MNQHQLPDHTTPRFSLLKKSHALLVVGLCHVHADEKGGRTQFESLLGLQLR